NLLIYPTSNLKHLTMTSKLTIFTIFSLTLILVFSFPQHTLQRQQYSSTSIISYTEEDATLAFEAFNKTFYDKELNLYHSTSAREGLGSIWTQAIFWDIIMDSYLRTNRS